MEIFTAKFLAETLRANIGRVNSANGLDQGELGLAEFKQGLRERIAIFESGGWFEGDGFDED